MSDETLHLTSRLFLIFSIAIVAAFCGSVLAWPAAVVVGALCCLAVHRVATCA